VQNRTAPLKFKQVYACPPENCRTERHLPSDTTLKVWLTMYGTALFHERSRSDGQFLFTAPVRPWLANAIGCDPDTVDAGIARLLKLDWIVLVAKGRRRKDGTLGPNTYRLRTHDEFVKLHSGSCPPYPCKPNDEAKSILVAAKNMSTAELDQFLQHAPQLEPVRQIWRELDTILSAMPKAERAAWLESLKDGDASPVLTGEVTTPVPAATSPVQTGLDLSGSNTLTTPVPTPEPVRLKPEESFFILNKHTTHPILPAAPVVCDVLTSTPTTKGEREELLRRQNLSPAATPAPPLVEAVSAARAAELVGTLLAAGDGCGGTLTIRGKHQRKQLEALAIKHGEQMFCDACNVWLSESPWNAQTIAPYMSLIEGFEAYVGQVKRNAKETATKFTEKDIEAAKAAYRKQHAEIFKPFTEPKVDNPLELLG